MKSPEKISGKQFNKELQEFFDKKTYRGENATHCLLCHSAILAETCYVSLHASEFPDSCAGSGEVTQVDVPYCPKCESKPADRGCIHGRMFPVGGMRSVLHDIAVKIGLSK